MIVLDASAAFGALFGPASARERLRDGIVVIPHLADSELVQTVRRQVGAGVLSADDGLRGLAVWSRLELRRHAIHRLLGRVWALRDNLTAYDATYVALAEHLGCPLVTADRRLARSVGPHCEIVLVGAGEGA